MKVAHHLKLDREDLRARVIMAQVRQNTNYAITLYACHPFFVHGYSTMTNGENTAFVPIKEYLLSRGFPGYTGYESDSEVFTHILHYTLNTLNMAQDRKKLRPGVVGGRPGLYAFSSEICGLDAAIPSRDKSKDFQPMHLDTAIVGPNRQEVNICSQAEPLPLLH